MSAVCGRVQAPLNTAFPVKTMCYGHVLLCSSTPASTAHCAHIYIYIYVSAWLGLEFGHVQMPFWAGLQGWPCHPLCAV